MQLDNLFAWSLSGGCAIAVWSAFLTRLPIPRSMRLLRRLVPRRNGSAKLLPSSWGKGRSTRIQLRPRGRSVGLSSVPPRLLLLLLGLLLTLFGAAGLAARTMLGLSALNSALLAACAAGALLHWTLELTARLLETEAAGQTTGRTVLGMDGHISLAIPQSGVGQVAYVAEGRRATMPARSRDGRALAKNTRVLLLAIEGHIAEVVELESPGEERNP